MLCSIIFLVLNCVLFVKISPPHEPHKSYDLEYHVPILTYINCLGDI